MANNHNHQNVHNVHNNYFHHDLRSTVELCYLSKTLHERSRFAAEEAETDP